MDASAGLTALNRNAAPLVRAARRFGAWWIGELLAMMPRRAAPSRRLVVELEDEGRRARLCDAAQPDRPERLDLLAEPQASTSASAPAREYGEIVLRLSAAQVLRTRVSLPQAAEEDLRQVLTFEMDRLTPFRAEQVYFDCRVVRREPQRQRIAVALSLVPRATLDGVLGKLAARGLYPDAVQVACADDDEAGAPVDLLPAGHGRAPGAARSRTHRWLVMLLVVLACAALLIPLLQKRHALQTLGRELDGLAQQAGTAEELAQRMEHARHAAEFLRQKKRDAVPAVAVLDELTRVLPDTTWLERFELHKGVITIAGASSAAAELVPLLEAAPSFAAAAFASPITQDPRDSVERFVITANVVGEESR